MMGLQKMGVHLCFESGRMMVGHDVPPSFSGTGQLAAGLSVAFFFPVRRTHGLCR